MKSKYSFEDRGTDRWNRLRNVATLKDLLNVMNDIYDSNSNDTPTKAEN